MLTVTVNAIVRQLVWLGGVLTGTLLLHCGLLQAAVSQSWERTPYRVQLMVAAVPELDQKTMDQLLVDLVERAEAVVGPGWQLKVVLDEGPLRYQIIRGISTLGPEVIDERWLTQDKVVVLGIETLPDRLRLTARDFDCRLRRWGTPMARDVRQTARLFPAAFQTVWEAFSPLAQMKIGADKRVVLKPRAAALPPRDSSLRWVDVGDLLLPIVRRNDREGKPRAIEAVPWTFLLVDRAEAGVIGCSVESATRNPLNLRRRGKIEQLALAIRPPRSTTRLELRAKTDSERPLIGYEIYSRVPGLDHSRYLGRTDERGGLLVGPANGPLRLLFVKHGDALLARLPVVPGLVSTQTALLPDDEQRLEVEGYVRGLRDQLVDLVTRRQVLIARIRQNLKAGNYGAAKGHMETLRRLPTREQFSQRVAQRQRLSFSHNMRTQAKTDKLFSDLKKMLTKFLDPRPINQLQTELDRSHKAVASSVEPDRSP